MKWTSITVFAACLLIMACQPQATSNNASTTNTNAPAAKKEPETTKKAHLTDLKQLAERVVNQSAGVKEGEVVLISGSTRDMDLLEHLVVETEKIGAYPLLTLGSDNMTKRSYTDVPEKFDGREPKLGMALARIANVSINVDTGATEDLFADIPPARLQARAKAGLPATNEFIKNKIRNISIGNDLYPTEWRAKRFEMPVDNFAKLFWEGINIDYTNLQATGEKARAAMTGKEVEITHPNGTSIKANLDTKPVYISDGIISTDDVAKGSLNAYLPAGEAAMLTAPNSGTGKFVIEKNFFNGKEINNVVLTFENGKLTSMTGEGEGFAAMKADFDARGGDKDMLSYIDIGINPSFALAPSTKVGNWVSAGMVSLGTGNNLWAGGTNDATGAVGGHLAGCTVKIDGKVIVENGNLKL